MELRSGTGETDGGMSSDSSVHASATAEQPLSASRPMIASTSSRDSAEYRPITSSSRMIPCSVVASAGSGTIVAMPRASQRDW